MLDQALRNKIIVGGIHKYTFAINHLKIAIQETVNIKIKGKTAHENLLPFVLQPVQAQVEFIDKEDIGHENDEGDIVGITLPQLIHKRYQISFATKEQLKQMLQLMAQLAFPNIKGVNNSFQTDFFEKLMTDGIITDVINQPESEIKVEESKQTKRRKAAETKGIPTESTVTTHLLPKNKDGSVSPLLLNGDHQQPFANAELKPRKDQEDKCGWCCTIV